METTIVSWGSYGDIGKGFCTEGPGFKPERSIRLLLVDVLCLFILGGASRLSHLCFRGPVRAMRMLKPQTLISIWACGALHQLPRAVGSVVSSGWVSRCITTP